VQVTLGGCANGIATSPQHASSGPGTATAPNIITYPLLPLGHAHSCLHVLRLMLGLADGQRHKASWHLLCCTILPCYCSCADVCHTQELAQQKRPSRQSRCQIKQSHTSASLSKRWGKDSLLPRVGVKQGGCSGMSYVMDLEEEANLEVRLAAVVAAGRLSCSVHLSNALWPAAAVLPIAQAQPLSCICHGALCFDASLRPAYSTLNMPVLNWVSGCACQQQAAHLQCCYPFTMLLTQPGWAVLDHLGGDGGQAGISCGVSITHPTWSSCSPSTLTGSILPAADTDDVQCLLGGAVGSAEGSQSLE